MRYSVRWEESIEASSAEQAAQIAHKAIKTRKSLELAIINDCEDENDPIWFTIKS